MQGFDAPRSDSIRQFPLFASLPQDEVGHILACLGLRELQGGAILFCENDPGDCMYFILEGRVEIIKAMNTADQRLLAVRESPNFFGEMSLLDPHGVRSASARTLGTVRLLVLARTEFDRLLQSRPVLAYEMLRVVSLRLREAQTNTIADLRERNEKLTQAYEDLRAAQAQLIEKERLERELQVARSIQQSILPRAVPKVAGFDFGVRFVPARAVGGDLFDFISIGRGRQGIVIGDVSDKGVPAAIFMALTRSLLRAEIARNAPPGRVLRRVNQLLLEMNDAGMFVTLLYGILDQETRTFAYARAGHELPLLYDADGIELPVPFGRGHPLGLFENPALDEGVLTIPAGATLLLLTDGAGDIRDPSGERLGSERLAEAVQANLPAPSAQDFCDGLLQALGVFQNQAPQADDIALVAVRVCA